MFFLGNRATKYKRSLKKNLEENEKEKKGQRDTIQVLANGLTPCIYSILYIWNSGCGEKEIDFDSRTEAASLCSIGILGNYETRTSCISILNLL